jgi:hypothetical protein
VREIDGAYSVRTVCNSRTTEMATVLFDPRDEDGSGFDY